MSKERFKFRVWDDAEKKYNGFSFHLAMAGELDRLSVDGDLLETDPNRFTVEQCTGLRDKNGKLIFEGDVVKTKDFGKDIDNRINVNDYDVFLVEFQECGFYLVNESRCFPMSCRPKLEIIGNIHKMEVEK